MNTLQRGGRRTASHLRRVGGIAGILFILAMAGVPAEAQNLHDFVQAALARNPDLATLQARRQTIEAKRYAAETLTPGAPSFGARYVTDQVFRNRNAREAEIGISTPLWLPGEGTASRRVAEAELARSTVQGAGFKLKVAAQVRDVLGEFALAEAEMRVAEPRLNEARALEADVARRVKAREAPETDRLLARGDRLAAEADLAEKRSAREQSRIDFISLTGLPPVAASLIEADPPTHPPADHPRLDDARSAMEVARASQSLAAIQVRDSPEIGLVARRTRDTGSSVYDHSVGVELRIPFATEGRNAPRRAAAAAERTEAAIAFETARREVDAEQLKARSHYENAIAQRGLNRDRATALKQQSALIGAAYRQGQVSLLEYIRARVLAAEANAAQARGDLGIARARGRLNTAYGIIP